MSAVRIVVAAVVVAVAAPARADVSAAAKAFSEGQAAQLDGDYERAAQSFELAYTIKPSKEALRSAVRARQQANQLSRAATLAELLLSTYGDDATSAALARDVIADAKPKLARIAIACEAPCSVAAGGRAVTVAPARTHAVFLMPGTQELEISYDGDRVVQRKIDVHAGEDRALGVPLPADTTPPVKPEEPTPPETKHSTRRRLPPLVTFIGAGLTVAAGGFTLWSGLDTLSAHDDYVENPSDDKYDAGRRKQLRTNIGIGLTAGFAVTTGVIAAFFTRWHRAPTVTPTEGGGVVGVRGAF